MSTLFWFQMFTYNFNTAPLLSQVRMLVPDTVAPGIFSDDEVNQAIWLESAQGTYASGQAVPNGLPLSNTVQVYSVRRAAALLVDILANNWGKLAVIEQMLDVRINGPASAKALGDRAESLRKTEANSGAFAIAEWVLDPFSAQERVYKQMLRLYPG